MPIGTVLRRALTVLALCCGLTRLALAADPVHPRVYVDGPWGQIHARVVGREGEPTVVLLHQMTWSSAQFRFAQDELAARGVRSIAVDIPGYGMSDPPPSYPTAAQYADAMMPVLDHFRLQRATLLGTNTGATFFTLLADKHPERVARLILEGVPVWDAEGRAKLLAQPHPDVTVLPDGSHLLKHWNGSQAATAGRLSLQAMQESIMLGYEAGPNGWWAHDAVFATDLGPVVKRLKVPVTLIVYPGQDLYQISLGVKKMRPDFDLVTLNDVGQSMAPSYDNPKQWAEAVAKVVKAH